MRCRFLIPTLSIALFGMTSCDPETPIEQANRDGIFIMGNSAEPLALDLHMVSGVPEGKVITALFEGLVADHPTGDDVMAPGAAASWTHNDDLTEWTFKLQPDGRWSDGQPVTAHDFVFSYHRMLAPNLLAKYAELLFPIRNAETYNKDLRGEILFRLNPRESLPWETVQTVNFQGDPSLSAENLSARSWKNYDEDKKKRYVMGSGLDKITKEQLEWIAENPVQRFEWP
ncbi:MAG: ABC transporter substrate-binding protein, partial [Verrucomicrobiales bacterium]